MNGDLIAIATGFRFDSLLIIPRQDQETALRTCLLQCCSHERVDQFLQDDLAGDGLRHFDHHREVKVFDRCADRARGTSDRLLLAELRIVPIKLLYFAFGAPPEISCTELPENTHPLSCRSLVPHRIVRQPRRRSPRCGQSRLPSQSDASS